MTQAAEPTSEQISISLIDPNPHRSFDLYPIDKANVAKLKASYEDNGDFGVIPVRPHPTKKGRYEQACHHHCLEAMKESGWKKADCKVSNMDDDLMLGIMIAENARQQNENMASVLDAVAAVMCKLMYETIVTGKAPPDGYKRIQFSSKDELTPKQKAGIVSGGQSATVNVLRNGVGYLPIFAFTRQQLSADSVRSAVATLKASTQYAKLMQGVIARVLKEYDADSEQVARAGQLADAVAGKEAVKKAVNAGQAPAPKSASSSRPTASRTASGEKSAKTRDTRFDGPSGETRYREKVTADAQKHVPAPRGEFDAKAANVFKSTKQLDAFRKIVTAPAMAAVLPVNKQVEVAKAIAMDCEAKDVDITVKAITEFTGEKLAEFYVGQTKADKAAQKAAGRETAGMRLQVARDSLLRGLATVVEGAQRYEKEIKALDPEDIPAGDIEFIQKLQAYKQQIDKFFAALLPVKKAIGS